jgi:DNA-binding transcriptional LysR family regulator
MKIEELSLAALKYYMDAVELKSVTQSAAVNNVSRPAVSQAILRLEQWYGKPLLVHEKRLFELTPAGQEFYLRARASFNDFKRGLSTKAEDSKSFKIGCSASLIELAFSKIEKSLKKAPEPIIKIGTTDQLLGYLEDRSIDIVLALDNGKRNKFKKHEFRTGKFRCLSKSGSLENHLITTESRPEVEAFQKYAAKNKIQFSSHIVVESWTVAAQLARFNLGCCLVPDFIETTSLKKVEIAGWNSTYVAAAYVREDQFLSGLEQETLQAILGK